MSIQEFKTNNRNKPRPQKSKAASRGWESAMNTIKLIQGKDLLSRRMPIFPDRCKVILPYHENITVTAGAGGTVGNYVYSANGLYDPNITSTGHQPAGFDQMMLFYNHYTVVRSKIIAKVQTYGSVGGRFAVCSRASPSVTTNHEILVEDGFIDYEVMGSAGAYMSIRTFQRTMDITEFSGVDDVLDEHDYRGDSASNPVEQQYFHLSYWNPLDASQPVILVSLTMEFEAVFTEPRPVSGS